MTFIKCNLSGVGGAITIQQLKAESAMTISTTDQAHIGRSTISINVADYTTLKIWNTIAEYNNESQ